LLVVSCSDSYEAITREEQEKRFSDIFGFEPPKEIAEIKFKHVHIRYLTNGGWERWMRFTYSEDIFSRVIKARGSIKEGENHSAHLKSDAAPEWWPEVEPRLVYLHLRGHEDTRESEKYSFEEHMWHDANFVFLHTVNRH
jgi:hypothetical protein